MSKSASRARLAEIIRKRSFGRGEVTLASGRKSNFYFNLKPTMLDPEGATPEDPRQELVDRLLEHERFKNAAEMLQQKRLIEENVWSNPQIKAFISEDDDPGLAITLFDLVKAFGEMLGGVASSLG